MEYLELHDSLVVGHLYNKIAGIHSTQYRIMIVSSKVEQECVRLGYMVLVLVFSIFS
jgi:hypothetical protein